jgi:hypothetical protein
MTPQERDLIAGLFQRLKSVPNAPKDLEAERFIREQMAAQPDAAYYLAQTLLVQEHALRNGQERISELERRLSDARRSPAQEQSHGIGGFLSKILSGSQGPHRSPVRTQGGQTGYGAGSVPPPLPYAPTSGMGTGAGGSFLKTALGTAAGVAGGAMLFQGIQSLLGYHAGPFSGALDHVAGHGGAGEGHQDVNITNNYYGDEGSQSDQSSAGFSNSATDGGFFAGEPDPIEPMDSGSGSDMGDDYGDDYGGGGGDDSFV